MNDPGLITFIALLIQKLVHLLVIFNCRSPLIFKQPSLSSVSNIFVLPFQTKVWVASGVLLIVSTIILFVEIIITSRLLFWTRYSFLEVFMEILEEAFLQGIGQKLFQFPTFNIYVSDGFKKSNDSKNSEFHREMTNTIFDP